jgi:hypothetical protein
MSVRIVNAKAHASLYNRIKPGGGSHLIEEHIGDSNLIFGSTGWCVNQSQWWCDNFMGFLKATNITSALVNRGNNVSGHENGYNQRSLTNAGWGTWAASGGASVPPEWYDYVAHPDDGIGGFGVFNESRVNAGTATSTAIDNNGFSFLSLTQGQKLIGARDEINWHTWTVDGLGPGSAVQRPCWLRESSGSDAISVAVSFDAAEVGYKRTVVNKPAEPSYGFGRRCMFHGAGLTRTAPGNFLLGVAERPQITRGYACSPLVYIGGNGLRVFANGLAAAKNNVRGLRGSIWRDALDRPTQPILVWIRSGLNDRNDTDLSDDGVNDGDTPAGYVANALRVQDLVLDFYTRGGHSASDVYFAYSMGVPNRNDGNALMKSMGAAMEAAIGSFHQSVYLDSINDVTPAQLIANGGYASSDTDVNHLSSAAYTYFVGEELGSYVEEIEKASAVGGSRSRARYNRAR